MAVYRYGKKTSDINVQSDFNIKDTKSDAFIKNRPDSTLSIALDGVEQKKHYNPNTGSETINIDLSDTIIAQDNKLNNAIASLEVSRIGGSGKYISDVSEKDGKISATAVSTASTFSSTSTTAINGVGVNEALKTLDVAEVGEVGRYIEKIKETDGKISATLAVMDTTPTKDSKKAVTSSGVKAYIDDKISNLDVASVGGDGKYISAISETDGKITATVTSTNSTFSSTSTTAINGVGVNEALKTLNVAEVGSNGKYIQKIKEDNGKISATLKSFDTIISDESTDDNVPTSKAVNTKIFSEINKLNVNEVGEEGKYIEKILENSGKISTVVKTMDTAPTANSKKPVTSGGVKSYVDSLNKSLVGEDGSYIKTISESKGIITATKQTFDTTISSDSTDNNTPTSKAVKDYVDSEISNLNTDLTTAINGKQASGNYKTTQTAVSSPAASGNATAFIDTISQNANGVITVTKKNVPSVAGLMSAADKTKLDGLATHTTLSKTSTLSGMTKDEVYYINTTGITTTVSAITNMGIKLTFVTNVATTIKYYNTSGTLTTKSMDAGTVFFLFSCGSGYTPNLYGTVLDINPSSTSVGQIYIKTK